MIRGIMYAVIAAACNATVGAFSLNMLMLDISPIAISFYKCLVALCLLSFVLLVAPYKFEKYSFSSVVSIAIMAFLGVFGLYFFETMAYSFSKISQVVFTVLGTSTIVTALSSYFITKELRSITILYSVITALLGLFLFHLAAFEGNYLNTGLVCSIIAGIGYGGFLVLNKHSSTQHGITQLWYMMCFGVFFLAIPFFLSPYKSITLTNEAAINIVLLGIIPTIGGFYFTTKALSCTSAMVVQISELNEPLIASLLGILLFKQWLNAKELIGAIMIFSSIILVAKNHKVNFNHNIKENDCENFVARH